MQKASSAKDERPSKTARRDPASLEASPFASPMVSPRNDGNANSSNSIPAADLDQLFNTFRIDMLSEVDSNQKKLEQATSSNVENLLRQYDTHASARFGAVEADVSALKAANYKSEKYHKQFRSELDELRQGLAVSASAEASREWAENENWDRPPIPNIIRVNAPELVSREAILEMATTWLAKASLTPAEFTISNAPQGISKFWTIEFNGEQGLGMRRAKKALQCLRTQDGSYDELFVTTPNKHRVRAYTSADRSPKTIQLEIHTKRLLGAAKAAHPQAQWHCLKRDGVVTIAWQQAIRIVVNQDKSYEIKWNNKVATEQNLDKDKITEAFVATTGTSATGVEWCL